MARNKRNKKPKTVEEAQKKYPTATLIKDWEHLKEVCKESDTHTVEINLDDCNGYIHCKEPKPYNSKKSWRTQAKHLDFHYLSTHTFYGKGQWYQSTWILRQCGFDVIIDNWDKKYEA